MGLLIELKREVWHNIAGEIGKSIAQIADFSVDISNFVELDRKDRSEGS